jgi:hypothetical protein
MVLRNFAGVYGFLAVFSAGITLRYLELWERGTDLPAQERELAIAPSNREDLATNPETAHAYLTQGLLDFSEQLEQIGEAVIVTIVGAILSLSHFPMDAGIWFLLLLFLFIHPISVAIG